MTKIKITESDEDIVIEMCGHAAYSEPGSDVVCAAVSTLEYIIHAWCKCNADKAVLKDRREDDGYVYMKIVPLSDDVYIVIEAAALGFAALADNFSENIFLNFLKNRER